MNKTKQTELLNQGFYIVVAMLPNAKHSDMMIKTYFASDKTCQIHFVYYNHVKRLLSPEQLTLIDNFNIVKNYQFRELVDLNIKKNSGKLSNHEAELLTLHKSKKDMQSITIENKEGLQS